MKAGGAVLALARTQPATAFAAWGLITRGAVLSNAIGGTCALACSLYRMSSIYQIAVTEGGTDWFIPFAQGAARYCDVPSGEANGRLVVTFPMNGCALEVRATGTGNRFFHDSDGNSMPPLGGTVRKFRAEYADYAGPNNTTHERSLRYFGPDNAMSDTPNAGGYEHNVFCVKNGGNWEVWASAVIRLNGDAWQIKDRVPYRLGQFAD